MNALAGTGTLIRLALRRDRIMLPIWAVVIGVLPASTAGAYDRLYPTAAARASLIASTGANPSLAVLYGPPFDVSTAGGFTAWRYGSLFPVLIALAGIFTVTRHTRAQEDTGRQELLSSAVLGRYAALTAAVAVAGCGALLTGLLTAITMTGAGLPAAGSFAFGISGALTACVFVAVAAVAAQLGEYSRTANGMATATLGVAFLLRAVGDANPDAGWVSWLSPLGWSARVRAFAGERWWVLALLAGTAVLVAAVAYRLLPRRDVGMSLLPARPGAATATTGLRSPLALAWRLHRGMLTGWLVAFAIAGALFGSLAEGIGDLVGGSAETREIFVRMGGSTGMVDAYLAAMAGMFGMVAALYAVQATLRMHAEEVSVRAEPLLATGVHRLRWAASHLLFALGGSALLLAVSGTATGLLHGVQTGDAGHQVAAVLGATMVQLPGVWVVVAAAMLLFGVVPKLAAVAWAVAAVFLGISLFGPVAGVDQAVLDISPFSHAPKLPSVALTAKPLLWLAGIAVVGLAAGLAAFRRRDVG